MKVTTSDIEEIDTRFPGYIDAIYAATYDHTVWVYTLNGVIRPELNIVVGGSIFEPTLASLKYVHFPRNSAMRLPKRVNPLNHEHTIFVALTPDQLAMAQHGMFPAGRIRLIHDGKVINAYTLTTDGFRRVFG